MNDSKELANRIKDWYLAIDKAAVALSGGIDSSLVAYTARKMLGKDNVIAVISASASVKQRELEDARSFTAAFDIALIEVNTREIDNPDYARNPVNRCYFCKSALYSELDLVIGRDYPGHTVLNGNNYSDLGDYRPGLEAAGQHKVRSPLAECRFTKDDIRTLARFYGLPNWNKPASPCLSSRFPYGEHITKEKLRMVELAEDVLNEFGFDDVRVRYMGNTAKIEVPASRIPELQNHFTAIRPRVTSVGFDACVIDPEGLVSGKLNRDLPNS